MPWQTPSLTVRSEPGEKSAVWPIGRDDSSSLLHRVRGKLGALMSEPENVHVIALIWLRRVYAVKGFIR